MPPFTIRAVSAQGRLAASAREVQAAAPGWETIRMLKAMHAALAEAPTAICSGPKYLAKAALARAISIFAQKRAHLRVYVLY